MDTGRPEAYPGEYDSICSGSGVPAENMFAGDVPAIDGLVESVLGGVLIGNGLGDELQDVRARWGDEIASEVEQRIEESK